MTLISTHGALFKDELKKSATEIINMTLNIGTKQINQDIREASGELLAQVAAQVADFEDDDEDSKETAKDVIDLLTQVWNEENEHSLKIEPTVKAVGILSKGIRSILGEDTLKIYLEKLMFVEMNTYRIVEEFGDLSNPETEVKKFKVILKKQKQMISFLTSYAHFVTNMDLPPGERECQHFFDLALTATRNFRKLYVKWRPKFLEALASLIMSLHKHQAMFIHWIVKFVKQAIGDIITSHAGVTQAELEESLDDSVHFWKGLIEATKEISEPTCVQIYDALLNTVIGYISSVIDGDNVVLNATEYDKHSSAFLSRLTDFMILLLPNCESQWFVRWYPNYVLQIQKLMRTHENSKLYLLMAVPLLTVSVEDLTSSKNNQIFSIIQKWITTTALPQLGDYKSGFLTIGTSERNKHILLDFIEKIGQLIKTEKSRKEIFEFLFSFIVSNKETASAQDDDEERKDLPNIRKGRAMAIKKLRAAKEKTDSKKNEKDIIEVRIIGLLGKLGGINHKVIKEDTESDYVSENANFVEIITERIAAMDIGVNIQEFGITVKLNSILSNIIEVAESDIDYENKTEACSILNSLTTYFKGLNFKKRLPDLEEDLSPFTALAVEFSRWHAVNIDFDDKHTKTFLEAIQEMSFATHKYMSLEIASRCIRDYTLTLLSTKSVNKGNRMCKAILRNLQSDSSHPDVARRYACIYHFKEILKITKEQRFPLFEF